MTASEATAGRRSPGRRWRALAGAVPALILALIAIWEVVAIARAGADVPGDADWRRAAQELRSHHRPGELIVVAPGWLDPTMRQHLGDLVSLEMAGRMDAATYGTIWELSARGQRAPETRGLEVDDRWRFGELSLRRYRRDPAETVFDFDDELAVAKVDGAIGRRPRRVLEEVGFEPHHCARVTPRPGGTVRIRYSDVPLGDRLVGHVGLADVFTRRDVREPGRLAVRIDGRPVVEVTFGVDDGWVRFSADTEPTDSAEVTFAATALGPEARERLICFAAEARR